MRLNLLLFFGWCHSTATPEQLASLSPTHISNIGPRPSRVLVKSAWCAPPPYMFNGKAINCTNNSISRKITIGKTFNRSSYHIQMHLQCVPMIHWMVGVKKQAIGDSKNCCECFFRFLVWLAGITNIYVLLFMFYWNTWVKNNKVWARHFDWSGSQLVVCPQNKTHENILSTYIVNKQILYFFTQSD